MELNKIHNCDCVDFMNNIADEKSVDVVITSPPYNTTRGGDLKTRQGRYETYDDNMTNEEYIDWTIKIFDGFDRILKHDGCVLYNLSYSTESPELIWQVVYNIMSRTNFTCVDTIVWKKRSALPNNMNKNRLTRICEFVFVFCRKSEEMTFNAYKGGAPLAKTGQMYYKNVFNLIDAANNDETCEIHKATYSTELCTKLMKIYTQENDVIYDPFMGTGTTAVACIKNSRNYIGTEIVDKYCEYADNRIKASCPIEETLF